VKKEIGQYYIEDSAGTIENVYQDSINTSPIIFILSQGADPTIMLLKFAEDHKYRDKMAMLSLGQGQGPAAKRLICAAQLRGDWVLLQNCHLAKSWMRELEQLVEAFKEVKNLHEEFRLFLTSMPAEYFPASVLQNGVKLTTEPPRGIKANLKRSYQELTQETFEKCEKKSETWRKLLFGLCFFHSVVQERRKFGPLGFNIRYEFNDSDLETSITMLRMLLDEQEGVPWKALNYITGHINYGGRVTDDWDRRCLLSILQIFYTPEILKSEYTFSASGIYFAPLCDKLDEYRKYIEELPLNDPPEVFGMHENANITYQLNESATVLQTILKVQPRVATS
jgi:dynein heavy chain